ncbi:MAG: glycosyltransferase family 4 protein [Coleofasciculaceae cyanobacterium RL_1_1]|nr:glycosyltransferase family 4 protein [Coleofasciculaceae cyanobacterium RL_1_1]
MRAADLFLFLQIFDAEGGIQTYNQNLLTAYIQHRDESDRLPQADVMLLRDSGQRSNPLHSRRLRFQYFAKGYHPWLQQVYFSIAFLYRVVRHRPRQVYCGHINLVSLVAFACLFLGLPYTVIVHGKEVWNRLPYFKRKALQKADCIWVVSRYSQALASQANQLNPKQFQHLPCCVDGQVFTPAPKPDYLLDRYQLQGASVIMTVTRLWSGDIYKGVDVTIRALPEIIQAVPQVKYLIVGRGDDRPRLEALVAQLGLQDRVVFAGFVDDHELPDHYRVADLYSMPSREGFGIVYLEAMATGVPVIAGNDDGSADPLMDGKLGWPVPYRDHHATAQACIEALTGQDPRSDRSWLRQEVLAHFGKEAFAQRVQNLCA